MDISHSVCLFVCLSVCLSLNLSPKNNYMTRVFSSLPHSFAQDMALMFPSCHDVCASLRLLICQSVCWLLFFGFSTYLSVCLSVNIPMVYLSLFLSVSLSICLFSKKSYAQGFFLVTKRHDTDVFILNMNNVL